MTWRRIWPPASGGMAEPVKITDSCHLESDEFAEQLPELPKGYRLCLKLNAKRLKVRKIFSDQGITPCIPSKMGRKTHHHRKRVVGPNNILEDRVTTQLLKRFAFDLRRSALTSGHATAWAGAKAPTEGQAGAGPGRFAPRTEIARLIQIKRKLR